MKLRTLNPKLKIMAQHNELGREGEDLAAAYLEKKGFIILERNWQYNHKEIDLIAMDGDYLVIVEVKTRTSAGWENPREAITKKKIRFIVEATEAYIMERDIENEVRFDVITLIPNGTEWEIEYIDEAFHPEL